MSNALEYKLMPDLLLTVIEGRHWVKQSGIYLIRDSVKGRLYVGSAKSLGGRKAKHLCDLRKRRHHSPKLQHIANKYGVDVLTFYLLELAELEFLIEREQHWAAIIKPDLNIAPIQRCPMQGRKHTPEALEKIRAASTGRVPSLETRAKLSVAKSGARHHMFGKHHSEEARIKIGNAGRGKKRSAEYCQRQSEARRGSKCYMWGKKRSPEAYAKMVATMGGIHPWTGRKHTEESKRKMSEAWKHRAPISEETRQKRRIASAGERNPRFGVKLSEETKKKQRDAWRMRKLREQSKGLEQGVLFV